MLLSIVLTLKPINNCDLSLTTGNFAHACLLNLLKDKDACLADDLHNEGRYKPFTLSPLQGEFINQNGRITLKAEKEYWLRITSLEEKLSDLLIGLVHKYPPSIILEREEFELKRVTVSPGESDWGSTTTYEDLYNSWIPTQEDPGYKIKMKFFSPTTFRSNGQNLPIPLPNLIFMGLAEKWNRYSPVDLGSDISKIASDWLTIARYELKTRMLDFGKYRQVGFVGEAEFITKRDDDDLLRRVFHLLAGFAFYAGVGYKTTMGMGQARKI